MATDEGEEGDAEMATEEGEEGDAANLDINEEIFYTTGDLAKSNTGRYKCLCCSYSVTNSACVIHHIAKKHPQYTHKTTRRNSDSWPRLGIKTWTEDEVSDPQKILIFTTGDIEKVKGKFKCFDCSYHGWRTDDVCRHIAYHHPRFVRQRTRISQPGPKDKAQSSNNSNINCEIENSGNNIEKRTGKRPVASISPSPTRRSTRIRRAINYPDCRLSRLTSDSTPDEETFQFKKPLLPSRRNKRTNVGGFGSVNQSTCNDETLPKVEEEYDYGRESNFKYLNNDGADTQLENEFIYWRDPFDDSLDITGPPTKNCFEEIPENIRSVDLCTENTVCSDYLLSWNGENPDEENSTLMSMLGMDAQMNIRKESEEISFDNTYCRDGRNRLYGAQNDILIEDPVIIQIDSDGEAEVMEISESGKNRQYVNRVSNDEDPLLVKLQTANKNLNISINSWKTRFEKEIAKLKDELHKRNGNATFHKTENETTICSSINDHQVSELMRQLEISRTVIFAKEREVEKLTSKNEELNRQLRRANENAMEVFKQRENALLNKLADAEHELETSRKVIELREKADKLHQEEQVEQERMMKIQQDAERALKAKKLAREEALREIEVFKATLSINK